ncbi:unnamed protein product [Hymenolepis diminuta]|uniref:Cullin family profile domain-containing protein n=1 Tax=Hymenolepis diminuta TaxID=6216 RepID=A0A564YHI6_HYMDI|nr:unnamed protein product [Hymenolepis diminuta]
MVLHSQAWPISKQEEVHLPVELEQCVRVYTKFYREHRPGTKLGWCFQVSHGDIVPLYTKRRFSFEVSTYQIAILMLFNNANCYTVRQITQLTNVEEYQVIQILNYFLQKRILMVTESDGSEEQLTQQQVGLSGSITSIPTLTEDTLITLYFNYTNKNTRIYLHFLSKSEEKAETQKAMACIESDRKDIIGACIVRILKTRKRLSLQELWEEVRKQLASHFNPSLPQLKLNIEKLIERGFIRRDPNDMKVYEYIA